MDDMITKIEEKIKSNDYIDKFNYDSYSIYQDVIKNNQFLIDRIAVSEKELAKILGKGYSLSTLSNLRIQGIHFIEYIQFQKKGRVLYPMVFICQFLSGSKISKKEEWTKWQILQTQIVKSQTVNDNNLAKLLAIKPSTVSNYGKNEFFIKKIRKSYTINNISNWIVNSAIKSIT